MAAGREPRPPSLPSSVVARAEGIVGPIERVERLGGLSGGVVRLIGAAGSILVKADPDGNEAGFYRHAAGALSRAGVTTPHCHVAARHGQAWWLLLEDVPTPLPQGRWLADPAVLTVLARLHSSTNVWSGSFRPVWSSAMTDAALVGTSEPSLGQLREALGHLRREAEQMGLFEPRSPISGDPNPLNWGLHSDGRPVLYDWARYGLGHPALDLAITVPGLGQAEEFKTVARGYLAAGGPTDLGVDRLARAITIAKAWVLVEFLAGPARRAGEGARIGDRIRERIGPWLRTIPAGGR